MPTAEERLRAAHRWAIAHGFFHGWPNFEEADYHDGRGPVHGTQLLRPGEHVEWRDVPRRELAAPALSNVEGCWRAVHRWAVGHGYATGMPTFEKANHGRGVVYGTVLLKPGPHLRWQDVPLAELDGRPKFADPGGVIRSINRWASRHGYAAGLPTFEQADHHDGRGQVYGSFGLVAADHLHWRDVPARQLTSVASQSARDWVNYPQTLRVTPRSLAAPGSLADLVDLVREAEAAGQRVHAFGSRWSFSECAVTSDCLVDTTHLNRDLKTLSGALRPGQLPDLFHVEAGVTIRGLYNRLQAAGLALETMGGASGQTLAGAISTGTHGGDKAMAPLADSILALHLVGAGGAQYWVEPSCGITEPGLLPAYVAPGIDPGNVIYDDATFNACLVSLGCMGVIYAVVLRVRKPYDLAETTVEMTWRFFRDNAATYLNDPNGRFLQVILNPYKDASGENLCLLTTRSEAAATRPAVRPDRTHAVQVAVAAMLATMEARAPGTMAILHHRGVMKAFHDSTLTDEQKLGKLIDGILAHTPHHRPVLVGSYGSILRARWPQETFRASSFSVMDLGYGKEIPASQPGFSIELHFPAMDANGRPGFADFVDGLISLVDKAAETFFAGYCSLRFTGPTRAFLGMQQWNQTCTVELSFVQEVRGVTALRDEIYRLGLEHGGLPHWGQELDLGVQGHGNRYRQYEQWRQVYARMSGNFSARTFENDLSARWRLTTPGQAECREEDALQSSGVT